MSVTYLKCKECFGTGMVDNYALPVYNAAASDYGVAGMYVPEHREELCRNCEGEGTYEIEE